MRKVIHGCSLDSEVSVEEFLMSAFMRLVILAAAVVLLGSVRTASAQPTYDLSWNTIDCGGETSALGDYQVSGSIGQPDASDMSVGDYALSGGYWTSIDAPGCGSADFNCDGDIGTDADIEAFFACLSGSCPAPPCPNSADFNADGDVGTDSDIEAFFRVLAGGSC
jgi:hypothetical protein